MRLFSELCFFVLCSSVVDLCLLAQRDPVRQDSRPIRNGVLLDADVRSEEWSSLSLPRNGLSPIAPLLVEKDVYAEFTREMIRLQWRDGDPIYLFVILPKGIARPPVIVYLYSFPAETDRFLDDGFCKLLAKDGFAAAGFLSALTGHRYHDRPMREWFISELQESLVKTAHDVSMILDYLATRVDLDATRVGMFGEGSGGTIAILAATVDSRLRAIDLLDPVGKLPQLTTLPIRYQYLTKPTVTPQKVRDRLQATLPRQALIINQDKGLKGYKSSGGSDFFDWIKEQVRHVATR